MEDLITKAINDHQDAVGALGSLVPAIREVGGVMHEALRQGGKVLWMGNGGSAADSQHLAAELMGRFQRERSALSSIALTTDSSLMTAVSNDYGYERVFARQVEGLAGPRDVVVGISTSGGSPNVVEGLKEAKRLGARTVSFTGEKEGAMAEFSDFRLSVPSSVTARVQEVHILIGHILCDIVETLHCEEGARV